MKPGLYYSVEFSLLHFPQVYHNGIEFLSLPPLFFPFFFPVIIGFAFSFYFPDCRNDPFFCRCCLLNLQRIIRRTPFFTGDRSLFAEWGGNMRYKHDATSHNYVLQSRIKFPGVIRKQLITHDLSSLA